MRTWIVSVAISLLGVVVVCGADYSPSSLSQTTLTLGSNVVMKFVYIDFELIKQGGFWRPEHGHNKVEYRVTITKPFFIGTHEVTHEQWDAVMLGDKYKFKPNKYPVDGYSWDSVNLFIKQLRRQHHGYNFNLPTEAQWELACRAGSPDNYCYGDDVRELHKYAWYKTKTNSVIKLHEVGLLMPNKWGLYDMHGNVWEWCRDVYGELKKGDQIDPSGPPRDAPNAFTCRVRRGGAYDCDASKLTASCRGRLSSNNPFTFFKTGFRVVFNLE